MFRAPVYAYVYVQHTIHIQMTFAFVTNPDKQVCTHAPTYTRTHRGLLAHIYTHKYTHTYTISTTLA